MQKILVVDDEKAIREMIKRGLRHHHVLLASDAEEALSILDTEKVALCVVDVMMPGMDGFMLCDHIKNYYDKPVIMLTARNELSDKRTAFEAGTDDYVTKPFIVEELAFRIKAVLNRYQQQSSLAFGGLVLDVDSYEVKIDNQTLYLPRKEFEVLAELIRLSPKVATREHLIEHIWGFDFNGDARTVDVHVKRLRKRLTIDPHIEIVTVRGVGYKVQHV
ncbi:response regulator transcription factor [Macrococcus hajekii]|uniref:Heme response regulator HssR n=1 Tax=Macrococcus hajekii TaxID=198482 RepID=A0A4R6BN13_9STAP|nr:response regulator transcription factor [Macrococcus hajekii]TDM03233.1 response regulator transcription factor [Macrococcus hajekii]GGA97176.1 heme response regulator HssR [Macrococcus hajekii]